MALNMLSTGAMVRLGYVYGNLMVNMHRSNSKLAERSIRIVQQALGISKDEARSAMQRATNSMPAAIVMAKAKLGRAEADRRLKAAKGNVRKAIEQHG
jgi:N-acetylmuramic acid 6-phosphate etherase